MNICSVSPYRYPMPAPSYTACAPEPFCHDCYSPGYYYPRPRSFLSRAAGGALGGYVGFNLGGYVGSMFGPAGYAVGSITGAVMGGSSGWAAGFPKTALTTLGGYLGLGVGASVLGGWPGVLVGGLGGAFLGGALADRLHL